MKTKTKRRLFLIAAPLTILLALALAYLAISYGPTTELSCRLAWWHNQGSVNCNANGEAVSLEGIPVTLTTENATENAVIQDGHFLFRKGDYGKNIVHFTIPAALYDGDADIPITAEFFSANSWHVNLFMLPVSINTKSATVNIEGWVLSFTGSEFHYFNTVTAPLDGTEIILAASGI